MGKTGGSLVEVTSWYASHTHPLTSPLNTVLIPAAACDIRYLITCLFFCLLLFISVITATAGFVFSPSSKASGQAIGSAAVSFANGAKVIQPSLIS